MVEASVSFERNPDFVFRKVIEELILVPIRQDVADMDYIFTLNQVGAFIWEHLAHPASQADLKAALLEEFDADPEVLTADLERFIDEMIAINAVREV